MGNYRQHLTLSTATGAVFAGFSWWPCGFPATTCLVAGGLCSLGGLLPDIDSDTSRSFRDYMWMTGSIASTLVANRLYTMEIDAEMTIFIGVSIFMGIRYGLASIIKKFTIHRGIIHSIPAAVISGELVYLLSAGNFEQRLLKAIGFALGFFSHLLLDEICSFTKVDGKIHVKKSFGTALKLFNRSKLQVAFGCYLVLGLLTWLCFHQPDWMLQQMDRQLDHIAGWGIKGTEKFTQATDHAQKQLVNTSGIESLKDQFPEQLDDFKSSLSHLFAEKNPVESPPVVASAGDYSGISRETDANTPKRRGLQSLFQRPSGGGQIQKQQENSEPFRSTLENPFSESAPHRSSAEQSLNLSHQEPTNPPPRVLPPERHKVPIIPMPPVQY